MLIAAVFALIVGQLDLWPVRLMVVRGAGYGMIVNPAFDVVIILRVILRYIDVDRFLLGVISVP